MVKLVELEADMIVITYSLDNWHTTNKSFKTKQFTVNSGVNCGVVIEATLTLPVSGFTFCQELLSVDKLLLFYATFTSTPSGIYLLSLNLFHLIILCFINAIYFNKRNFSTQENTSRGLGKDFSISRSVAQSFYFYIFRQMHCIDESWLVLLVCRNWSHLHLNSFKRIIWSLPRVPHYSLPRYLCCTSKIQTIQMSSHAILIPPSCLITLCTVTTTDIIVTVMCAKLLIVAEAQGVTCITALKLKIIKRNKLYDFTALYQHRLNFMNIVSYNIYRYTKLDTL